MEEGIPAGQGSGVESSMKINVSRYSNEHSFEVDGVSYIGAPRSGTAMFVTRKVGQMVSALKDAECCLVFAQTGIDVPNEILEKHCFVFSENPQERYARFTELLHDAEEKEQAEAGYEVSAEGAFISRTAKIGNDTRIEPGAVIGPGVVIGSRCRIMAGAVIKNAVIGDHVTVNEQAVIGTGGFTMAEDEDGNRIRICSLGRVVIGDHAEIGAHDSISRGSGGVTLIDDYVKIDALVYIAHDVHLHRNVMIASRVSVGGYTEVSEGAYIGLGAAVRNRVRLGAHCFVGMGAVVTKSVEEGITVVGIPARPFEG